MAARPPALELLVDVVPGLRRVALPWASLGVLPTPLEPLPALDAAAGAPVFVKRDDVSGERYGGNKIRSLEPLLGRARARGARVVWATGAYGSNQALATALVARDAGLDAGVMLFPQPPTGCARENLLATLAARPRVRPLLGWATLPAVAWRTALRPGHVVLPPGGANPTGALGYVAGALELATQVAGGAAPPPVRIVVGAGSTCTAAGLLVGLALARRRGLLASLPTVEAVRVTPWPVTARWRVLRLAGRAARALAELAGDPDLATLVDEAAGALRVVGDQLGRGYGYPTSAGLDAIATFARVRGPALDCCYSAKAAATLLRGGPGPVVFWATKSTRPLQLADAGTVTRAPRAMRRWLARPVVEAAQGRGQPETGTGTRGVALDEEPERRRHL